MQAAKTTERQPAGRSKIAHRTGTSFTNKEGMTGAINDYGIIELPGKKKIYIAVFVHNTYESFDESEKIISDIGRAAYDYYTKNKQWVVGCQLIVKPQNCLIVEP